MILTLQLPPRECGGNSSVHWSKKAKAIRQYRQDARIIYMAHEQSLNLPSIPKSNTTPIRISATFYTFKCIGTDDRYRPRDWDNAIRSLKPAVDGLVDGGLIPDDNHNYLSWGEVKIIPSVKHKDANGKPRVVLTIEIVEP